MAKKEYIGTILANENTILEYYFFCEESEYDEHFSKLNFAKDNYFYMIDKILNELFSWQENKSISFQLWREKTMDFEKIVFKNPKEIKQYLGKDIVNIILSEGKLYIGIDFYEDCLISGHGIGAVFDELELLKVAADNSENMVYNISIEKRWENMSQEEIDKDIDDAQQRYLEEVDSGK